MKAFNLNLGTTIFRLYLMMLVVVLAGFVGYWPLAFLALPIFLFTLLGIEFKMTQGKTMGRAFRHGVIFMIRHLRIPEHHTV